MKTSRRTKAGRVRWLQQFIPWVLFFLAVSYGQLVETNNSRRTKQRLNERGVWMTELTEAIGRAGASRWRADDEQAAWRQFLQTNPQLTVPVDFLPLDPPVHRIDLPEVPKVNW